MIILLIHTSACSSIVFSRERKCCSSLFAALAHFYRAFVAEFAVVGQLVAAALLAVAIAAPHAVVDLPDLNQAAVVLVWHLESSIALRILALEC